MLFWYSVNGSPLRYSCTALLPEEKWNENMFNSSTMTDGCTNTHESSWNWLLAVTEEIFTCLELQIVFAHLQMSVQNFLHAMIRLNKKITQTCYRFGQVSYSSCVWRKLVIPVRWNILWSFYCHSILDCCLAWLHIPPEREQIHALT